MVVEAVGCWGKHVKEFEFCIEKSMPLEFYQDSDWNSELFFSCFMEATVQVQHMRSTRERSRQIHD